MNHAAAVRTVDRVRKVRENSPRLVARQPPLESQSLGECSAAYVAHDEVPDTADFPERVQRQNPRMGQLRRNACLAAEPFASLGGERKLGTQNLDRDETLE